MVIVISKKLTMKKFAQLKKNLLNLPVCFVVGFAISLSISGLVRAEKPETAPQKLIEAISKIDLAANNHDFDILEQYISPQFVSKDGLSYQAFRQSLQKLWQSYSNLQYTTTLKSWQQEGNQLLAETITEITGSYNSNGREIALSSLIRSLQHFENGQLISQEILSERTDLTSGENPPKVKVRLPEKVKTGEQFNFDVIAEQPLGSDILLGAAVEEKVDGDRYLNPDTIELDALSAGGIFKLVTAPQTPKDTWLSAILIRADGITLITQRVKVEE
jgi:hypothetical protein